MRDIIYRAHAVNCENCNIVRTKKKGVAELKQMNNLKNYSQ